MTPAKDQDSMTGRPSQAETAGEWGDTAGRRRMTQRPRALDVTCTTGSFPRPEKTEAGVQTGVGPGLGRPLARRWTAIPLPMMTGAAIEWAAESTTGPRHHATMTVTSRSNGRYVSQTGGGVGGNTRPSIRRRVLGPRQGMRVGMSSLGETTHALQMGTETVKAPVAMTEVLMLVSWLVVVVVAEVTTGASTRTGAGLPRTPATLIALNRIPAI